MKGLQTFGHLSDQNESLRDWLISLMLENLVATSETCDCAIGGMVKMNESVEPEDIRISY
jgi:hypothetical protein